MNCKPLLFIFAIIIVLLLPSVAYAAGSADDIDITVTIPDRKDGVFAPDKLVASGSGEGARITLENRGTETATISATIQVPDLLSLSVPTQELGGQITQDGNTLSVSPIEIAGGESATVRIRVTPPESIPMKTEETFRITTTVADGSRTEYTHPITIIPPPSWITYGTIIISLVLVAIVVIAVRRFGILEMYTTIDLVTIALLAALAGVVFRWFWQTFNDILGPFGGLLFTIPVSALMVIALHLVRKPGTAMLLFLVDQLVCMVIWGSNITVWLGWYLIEGAVVDAEVALFKGNYADTRIAAIIYGMSRGFISYWLFYFLFAPTAWKICYAPWYSWFQVGLAVVGGIIGGSIGYDAARKMRSAMM
ncbi:MAG: ECF transporter S component [Euryarchaeota archaeon]|nr:ECF transporter S component [Euryarchaeota archaeon]